MARNTIPNTPAGRTLQTWLGAFNSGNRARMESFLKAMAPGLSLDVMMSIRTSTGGFDLLAIERSAPLHIWFLASAKNTSTRIVGDFAVRGGMRPTIDFFWLTPLPPDGPPVVVTLNPALRQRVIDGVAADLTQFYVHPAVAAQMIAALRAHQEAGTYRDFSDGFQFANRLTSDLRAVSHDLHLRVMFRPFNAPPPQRPTARQLAQMREQVERGNCGFEKVEVLPGDIGYVKFNAFQSPGICAGTIEAAMAFVAHTRALIFDLRDNRGGQAETVAFIESYLFDRPTRLNDLRNRHTTTQFWTLPLLPGKRLSTQPVFVLTSHRTFSGAEAFSYDLKNLKRATIVGETTGGGAHTVGGHIVADYFLVWVPVDEAINPITHTNWEGTGVLPDVKVPAAAALKVAEQLATRDIQAAAGKSRPIEVQEPPRTTPSREAEAAVRRLIAGWEKGKPNYKDIGPGLEEIAFNRFGALKSLNVERVGRDGWHVYSAKFAHGRFQWKISPLSSDGRIPGKFFRPLTGKDPRKPAPR
ncbi:MAG: S41 family peptidase [Steroidobacteraceae bacterium]